MPDGFYHVEKKTTLPVFSVTMVFIADKIALLVVQQVTLSTPLGINCLGAVCIESRF